MDTLIRYLCCDQQSVEDKKTLLQSKKKTELAQLIGDRLSASMIKKTQKQELIQYIIDHELF